MAQAKLHRSLPGSRSSARQSRRQGSVSDHARRLLVCRCHGYDPDVEGVKRRALPELPNSVAACGIGQTATSTIASSRIIAASRADVDRCSASRASHQPDDIAAVTTNSGTSCALVLACASTFLPLHGAFHYMRRTAIALGMQARKLTEHRPAPVRRRVTPTALGGGSFTRRHD
jgi:hypothetical protein